MRLEPAEVPALPLVAVLLDRHGRLVAATPEWAGPGPGTLAYHAGQGSLLVAPDSPAPELDFLMARLLFQIEASASAVGGELGLCARVLAAGLALVAGRPATSSGTAEEVLALTLAAVAARTQGLLVQVTGPLPVGPVPAPAAIALALAQMAVNAEQHGGAERVLLRTGAGPVFFVEWPSTEPFHSSPHAHRHPRRRRRWGWGYVQMVADALGASALPPSPAGAGLMGAGLALGAPRLTLPLACVRGGLVERCTQAWEDDPAMTSLGQRVNGSLAELMADAAAHPGHTVYRDLYRARMVRDRAWLALGPAGGSSRALDMLRGLEHERALWSAPEPHATRVAALAILLRVAMGEAWPSVPPADFETGLTAACARLGVAKPEPLDVLCSPDPRVAAYLLSEVGGSLVEAREGVVLSAPAAVGHPLLQALGGHPDGWLRISP